MREYLPRLLDGAQEFITKPVSELLGD